MGSDGREQPGADSGYPVEPLERTERSLGLALGHDDLGQGKPHPRQAGQLRGGGPIGVDPLARLPAGGRGQDAVPVRQWRFRRQRGEQLHLPRRLAGAADPPAHTLTGEAQSEQHEQGAALGRRHGSMVGGRRYGGASGGNLRAGALSSRAQRGTLGTDRIHPAREDDWFAREHAGQILRCARDDSAPALAG